MNREQATALAEAYIRESGMKCTPSATFNNCASVAPVMAGRLTYLGHPAQQMKVVGLRRKLGPYAHKLWKKLEEEGRRDRFTHHVVLLGDWVLDPTGAQFGRTFPLVVDAPKYLEDWNEAYIIGSFGEVIREVK